MCLNFGGNGTAKKVTGKIGTPEATEQLPKKEEPRYELPVGNPGAPISSPGHDMWKDANEVGAQKQLEALSTGPDPTVVGANKSSLTLGNRRRKLIDSFKYGLSNQVARRTNSSSRPMSNKAKSKKYGSGYKPAPYYGPGKVKAA